ncbi:MAG: PAS domain S-box protein [Leptolyngbyaceae cyanobacterium RU_5_1]|nr:PAS domain S-box protein [Leptolyngbyaceae cyanobacterium RU_5_1]
MSVPEDVAEFMAQRLQKLPPTTQQILKLAACIGHQFDLATLAIACEVDSAVAAANLWRALKEGLILPTNEIYKFYQEADSSTLTPQFTHQIDYPLLNPTACTYRFLHDRVQQAAYSLIPADQKQATHRAIGQLLFRNTPEAEREEQIFEIVNQLNRGLNLVTQANERENLAQLNLIASRRAKHATAYGAALDYANVGVALLPQDCWQQCYPLALTFHELAVELAFLNGHFKQVDDQAQIVIRHAKTLLDQVNVYEVQILARTAENKPLQAVEIALELLKTLGVTLPDRPTDEDVRTVLSHTAALHRDQDISSLANLPEMTNGQAVAALQILNAIFASCYAVAPNLILLVAALGAQLSITHGNGPLSAIAYANYGMLLCGIVNDLESGYAFGQLALNLTSQFPQAAIETRVMCMVATFVLHWKRHLRETIPVLQAGHRSGIETGDIQFQAWGYYDECQAAYLTGQELTGLEQKLTAYGQALRQIKQEIPRDRSELLRQAVLNLLGRSLHPCQLVGEAHDEQQSRDRYQACKDTEGLYFLNFHKFILCYWFGDSRQALTFADLAKPHLNNVPAQAVVPVFYFYDSLVRLSLCSRVFGSDYEHLLECTDSNQQKIEFWSTYAPMNFQHKYELVAAEKYRVLGQRAEAIDGYDRAIALAKENGFVQEAALANELAARFYLDWGKVRIAQEYMTEAYYGYARWGAKAKITDLETRYSHLLTPILHDQPDPLTGDSALSAFSNQPFQRSTLPSGSGVSHALDLASVLTASQTLSSEIQLDKLLSILLKLVIENAGAEKGVFILHENQQLYVEAVMQVGATATVLQSIPLQDSLDVPINLIHTIKRMQQPLVIEDTMVYSSLSQDTYIQRQQPKSLLCLPILHQSKLLGVLYLENNLITGAFTSDRVEISNLLCAQAAISLANARLYRQSQTTLQTLQQSQQLLQLVMDTLPQRVFWKDRNFRYLGCNRHFAQDAGLPSPKQLIGKDDFELAWKELAHLYQEDDQFVMEHGISRIHYEERQMREDGSLVWLRTSKIPLRNQAREIIGVFGCYEDITLLKEAEESLHKSEAELRQKSEELAQTVQDLQQAQLQLVQNEKMSALGSLVAGVAHEINNPVGFLAGNLQPAKDYINDLFRLIERYQTTFPNPGPEVEAEMAAIDLEYMHDDLPKLLNSMQAGIDRIRTISTSLRIFSRADSDRPQPFDLHEGIDSTLLILKHRLRANETRPEIEIIKHYGELPLVECFAGQLNQVFMNLLANAVDALEESNQEQSFADIEADPNQITIQTQLIDDQWVAIQIQDNGIGIPDDVKHQIFDHLFTTKAIGKGTGLGLAIAHQIVVEKHRGTIRVDSTPGQGTEFVITIPVTARSEKDE